MQPMRIGLARWTSGLAAATIAAGWMMSAGCADGAGPDGADGPPGVSPARVDAPGTGGSPTVPSDGPPAGTDGSPGAAAPEPDAGTAAPADAEPIPDAPADGVSVPPSGLGPWTGNDNVAPSKQPPGGLRVDQAPLFVALGFDDNPDDEAVRWVMSVLAARKNPPGTGQAATHDGTVPRATFYNTSSFGSAAASWKAAQAAGHETGNHTVNHLHGAGGTGGMNFDAARWRMEIQGCSDFLTGPQVGARREEIAGFRTPFGQYNAALFPVLKELGFRYDCSIDEGNQPDQDGTNYFWPYTLDGGSPGHAARTDLPAIQSWPKGLWELPIYALLAPPDGQAQRYGVPPGLARKLGNNGKITGMDWNLWFGVRLTRPEFVAVLKYTLDQRRKGNRAPLLIGMHSKLYGAAGYEVPPAAPTAQARAAVVEFLDYALGFPEVRVVPTAAVLDWIRNPAPL
jgi:peptidoglycan/xylan/chitin deacetylase (PgdA/CDA1 family)